MASADSKIASVDTVFSELCSQPLVRGVGLGHYKQARGILVDAVDNPGARDPSNA
jgi:hypothetical protein